MLELHLPQSLGTLCYTPSSALPLIPLCATLNPWWSWPAYVQASFHPLISWGFLHVSMPFLGSFFLSISLLTDFSPFSCLKFCCLPPQLGRTTIIFLGFSFLCHGWKMIAKQRTVWSQAHCCQGSQSCTACCAPPQTVVLCILKLFMVGGLVLYQLLHLGQKQKVDFLIPKVIYFLITKLMQALYNNIKII